MASDFWDGLDLDGDQEQKPQASRVEVGKARNRAGVEKAPPAPAPRTSPPVQKPPGAPGPKYILLDLEDVENAVAELGLKQEHVAQWLATSPDTISRRLKDDPGFAEAWERGMARFRVKLSHEADTMRQKNALVFLATANQPHTLGWQNGRQEVSGRIEVQHTLNPAMLAFMKRRELDQRAGAQDIEVKQVGDGKGNQ